MKTVNSVEVISSHVICFDSGEQSFDEGTALALIISCHLGSSNLSFKVTARSAEQERGTASLAIDSSSTETHPQSCLDAAKQSPDEGT